MATAAAAPCCMRGAAPTISSKWASRRCMRTGSCAIDRCPILAPGLDGVVEAAWAISEVLKPAAKPLDIQATATEGGIDVDVRGSGPLTPQLTRRSRVSPTPTGWPVSPVTANWWHSAPNRPCGWGGPKWRCRRARSCRQPRLARIFWHGWCAPRWATAKAVADLFAGVGPFALRLAEHCARRRGRQR